MRTSENYEKGKKHGLFEAFYENGQLQSKANYKAGQLHGLSERFHENGQLEEKSHYKAGQLHGPSEKFDENGQLMSSRSFKDVELVGLEEMVSIPGGSFDMGDLSGEGSPFARPVRTVTVPAFRMGKYEVTFAQWDACVADGGCNGYSPDDEGWGRDDRPVIGVSWDDVHSFIDWLNNKTNGNYRLPTEAEWEYAARAGTTTDYSWGNDIGHNRANCDNDDCGDSWERTAPVGSFPPNPWGLHDMHGNVWEWVQDCWNASYDGAPTDGSAWTSGDCGQRVVRGGSWDNNPWPLRSAYRFRLDRSLRYYFLGFRLAQDE